MNSGSLCSAGAVDELFLVPASHVKQDKGRGKHTDSALAQGLPQALVCTPFGHRRMAALGADGQALSALVPCGAAFSTWCRSHSSC